MSTPRRDEKYSTGTGVIFLFNLIVGTGALALPSATQQCGILLGVSLILTLGLVSFITVTFVIEALAAANAMSRKRYENESAPLVPEPEEDQQQQDSIFEITEKYEIGQMGAIMTPKWCQVLIYFCLCIYLFGDLAIYEAVIGTTAAEVLCSFNRNATQTLDYDDLCFDNHSITVLNVNRLAIVTFIFLMGPFVFFNLQKTKSLQYFTGALRWLAFFVMLIWSICRLSIVGVEGHPTVLDLKAIPIMFGTAVYSFMCQHSLPSLLHPINNKKHLLRITVFDFSTIAVFYLALCLTAAFTFTKVQPLYSLNFWLEAAQPNTSLALVICAYYLTLFPVFTLSASFPIIAITLRNNLRALILRNSPSAWYYDRLLFPLLTILPPSIISLTVYDLSILVGVVGSYAGAGVQYLIPCLLVYYARSQTRDFDSPNIHGSPFKHEAWLYAVYTWMILSFTLITVNYVLKFKD